ncbi:MAG: nitroreductase family protein [Streptococcaceae bacterium]|jgi:predicted oxidoreductase (fatty acid repression mutant protein)|nr:nitroreductase family protein [Streptococcaceae bacterium]
MSFTDTLKKRRSVYVLGRNVQNEEEVLETIKTAIKYSPTAFNSQSHRAKILLGAAQDKLWGEIVPTALEAVMKEQGAPDEAIAATKEKLAGFQAGYGTVLFFEDQDVVNKLKVDFAFYADKFDGFSAQATGIVAANTWSALADLGVGANLQHYNPVIDEAVAAAFNIPASYKLESQLVFGSIEAPAGDKDFVADDVHFEVIK